VASDIGQRLLDHPECHQLDFRRQAIGPARNPDVHRDAGAMGELARERLQRCHQSEVVQHGRAQLQGHPPYALQRLGGQAAEVSHGALQ